MNYRIVIQSDSFMENFEEKIKQLNILLNTPIINNLSVFLFLFYDLAKYFSLLYLLVLQLFLLLPSLLCNLSTTYS